MIRHDNPSLFLSFLKNPTRVGALCPSSGALCNKITSDIGIENAPLVVELGSGTGVITEAIAARVRPGTRVVSIELDRSLCACLAGRFDNVEIVNDSASHLENILGERSLQSPSAIVSGLPWAAFPAPLQREILDSVCCSLAPDGCFTTFAYLQGLVLPAARRFRRMLAERFTRVETTRVIWRNLPPAIVYRCWEPTGTGRRAASN